MKKLLFTLFILPSFVFAQGSWLDVAVQADQYSNETSWVIMQDDSVLVTSPPYQPNQYLTTPVFLPAGDYTFIISDTFGDGICCEYGQGNYELKNFCGLYEANFEFTTAADTVDFTLEPCEIPVFGCMNELANNFNPWANIDNGTCNVVSCNEDQALVTMELTLDTWPNETGFTLVNLTNGQPYHEVLVNDYNFGDQLSTYTYDFCVSLGFELILYDLFGDGLNGSASGGEDGACVITSCDSVLWELEDLAFEEWDGIVMYSGAIFTEPCEPEPDVVGCMDDDYVDYNPLATIQDTCMTLHTWGCIDPTALNYDSLATIADYDSPCTLEIILEDDAGDGWGASTIGMVQGDQQWLFSVAPGEFSHTWELTLDSDEEVDVYYFQAGTQQQSPQELAFQTLHNSILILNENGDTLLTEGDNPFINNGQSALQPFSTPEWTVYHFTPFCGDGCIPYVYGCTDEAACNYDSEANTDSGCNYPVQYYDCENMCNNDMDEDGVCDELEIVGCQDPTAFNYNALATDPGECTPVIFGCTDPTQFNYNPEANTDNGGCVPYVYGCMNPEAFNYNPDANTELEDSCIEVLVDCMDPNAFNYNELANTSGEDLCLYDAGCITGPGEPYWLNDGCYAWIIDIDPYCCEVEWDETCIDLYSYCEQGWPQGVYDIHDVYGIYPNPASEVLNVRAPEGTVISIYNTTGQLVVAGTTDKVIDLTNLSKGVYKVVMEYNKRIINKKIIKS
tara:strand:+ start:231 stop:2432 length:2202 start_codon:yes stop_codon:yes gene_type:complete